MTKRTPHLLEADLGFVSRVAVGPSSLNDLELALFNLRNNWLLQLSEFDRLPNWGDDLLSRHVVIEADLFVRDRLLYFGCCHR